MADFWTVSGWAGTFVFGGLSVWQFLRDFKRSNVWDEREKSLRAIKLGLVQLRATLVEAQQTKRIIKTEAENQFVSSLGHQIMSIEHHINGMLGMDILNPPMPDNPHPAPTFWQRRRAR